MNSKNKITLTITKKQLKEIVSTMGMALETDCPAYSWSDEKLDRVLTLYTALQRMSKESN